MRCVYLAARDHLSGHSQEMYLVVRHVGCQPSLPACQPANLAAQKKKPGSPGAQ